MERRTSEFTLCSNERHERRGEKWNVFYRFLFLKKRVSSLLIFSILQKNEPKECLGRDHKTQKCLQLRNVLEERGSFDWEKHIEVKDEREMMSLTKNAWRKEKEDPERMTWLQTFTFMRFMARTILPFLGKHGEQSDAQFREKKTDRMKWKKEMNRREEREGLSLLLPAASSAKTILQCLLFSVSVSVSLAFLFCLFCVYLTAVAVSVTSFFISFLCLSLSSQVGPRFPFSSLEFLSLSFRCLIVWTSLLKFFLASERDRSQRQNSILYSLEFKSSHTTIFIAFHFVSHSIVFFTTASVSKAILIKVCFRRKSLR